MIWVLQTIKTFIEAAFDGNELTVLSLLNGNEVNVNDKNNIGWTALMFAVGYYKEIVASLLIDWEAYVDIKDNNGWTAVIYIAK